MPFAADTTASAEAKVPLRPPSAVRTVTLAGVAPLGVLLSAIAPSRLAVPVTWTVPTEPSFAIRVARVPAAVCT